jgi:hypothetical protein
LLYDHPVQHETYHSRLIFRIATRSTRIFAAAGI